MIATIAIATIAVAGFGFAATAIALGIRVGAIQSDNMELSLLLEMAEQEGEETRDEFNRYQSRTKRQMERYRNDIDEYKDLMATCDDPDVLHSFFDRMLQEATGEEAGEGDQSPNELP